MTEIKQESKSLSYRTYGWQKKDTIVLDRPLQPTNTRNRQTENNDPETFYKKWGREIQIIQTETNNLLNATLERKPEHLRISNYGGKESKIKIITNEKLGDWIFHLISNRLLVFEAENEAEKKKTILYNPEQNVDLINGLNGLVTLFQPEIQKLNTNLKNRLESQASKLGLNINRSENEESNIFTIELGPENFRDETETNTETVQNLENN